MADETPYPDPNHQIIHQQAELWTNKKARFDQERDDIYQALFAHGLEMLPKHKPHLASLDMWIWYAFSVFNPHTLTSPLSYPEYKQKQYRNLLGRNGSIGYDSFIHAAAAEGVERYEANVVWLNSGPTDYYAQTFDDVDSDFFNDGLALHGSEVEEEVLTATIVDEVMAIFAEHCQERPYRVWNLRQTKPDWTFEQIGQVLDPPISAPTANKDFKKAEAALHACAAIYWTQHHASEETDTA